MVGGRTGADALKVVPVLLYLQKLLYTGKDISHKIKIKPMFIIIIIIIIISLVSLTMSGGAVTMFIWCNPYT